MSGRADRPRVLLLCGGRSAEHDVSLASARSLLGETAGRLDWRPQVIDRDGTWLSAAASARRLAGEAPTRNDAGAAPVFDPALLDDVDVVFPLLHGPYGEDGRIQGALDVLGVRYVGSGVHGSAVGMDKPTMKAVFAAAGLPQVAYAGVTRDAWRRAPSEVDERLDALGWPVFVKPANLGSSIGIARADRRDARAAALSAAFAYDRRVIVEQAFVDGRELEVAVLGLDEPEVSVVGEIRFATEFYDYDTKYTMGRARLDVPADLPSDVADACRDLARHAFLAADAAGLARVDLFWSPERDELVVNEINTMPGFTATSMYPRLWAASGLPYPDLAARLVDLALVDR
ncbi:MAG: D-alanine--D-alanine ligase [Trueperaceae bacterium]|nr:D-alanine--D-alanine ligase [Trueperaceae bacterium]